MDSLGSRFFSSRQEPNSIRKPSLNSRRSNDRRESFRRITVQDTGLPDIDYPFHDKTIVVSRCGRLWLGKKKIYFSQVFAGQAVGIKEVHDHIWLVSFME